MSVGAMADTVRGADMGKRTGPKPRPPEEFFWSKVNKDGPVPAHRPELGPCWVWIPRKHRSGYAYLRLHGRQTRAHRASYTLAMGPIPDGLFVLHRCDVRSCVRPDHLFLGTQADNNRDMAAKGRAANVLVETQRAKTHCPQGHPYDEANTVHRRRRRVCRMCEREGGRERMRRHRVRKEATS